MYGPASDIWSVACMVGCDLPVSQTCLLFIVSIQIAPVSLYWCAIVSHTIEFAWCTCTCSGDSYTNNSYDCKTQFWLRKTTPDTGVVWVCLCVVCCCHHGNLTSLLCVCKSSIAWLYNGIWVIMFSHVHVPPLTQLFKEIQYYSGTSHCGHLSSMGTEVPL